MSNAASNKADYALYEKTACEYDRVRFSGRAGNWGHRRHVEVLNGICDDWRGKRVLEIGCGTGRITKMLVSWGSHVTATDISPEMLKVAQGRFENGDRSGRVEFRIMSVFDIDIDLASYDYIVMVNVLGRLSDPQGALDAIAAKMSAEARLVFSFPCLTSLLLPFGLLVNVRGRSLSRDVTSWWCTPKQIESYCRAAGLAVVGFKGNYYVPVPRLLFWTLPFFWSCDKLLAGPFPKLCPSAFVECRRSQG